MKHGEENTSYLREKTIYLREKKTKINTNTKKNKKKCREKKGSSESSSLINGPGRYSVATQVPKN